MGGELGYLGSDFFSDKKELTDLDTLPTTRNLNYLILYNYSFFSIPLKKIQLEKSRKKIK